MQFQLHRPQVYAGAGDRYLPGVVRGLKRFRVDAQAELADDTLRLRARELDDLAGVLVEFREDIHNHQARGHPLSKRVGNGPLLLSAV
jgi:hypothetical protein